MSSIIAVWTPFWRSAIAGIQRFEQGFLLRGLDIEVTLDGSGFTGAGDVHLFGDMLNRFSHCMPI